MRSLVPVTLVALCSFGTSALGRAADEALAASIAQLRDAIGTWSVTTEFLNEDGSVARSVEGSYEFEWVVRDRVVRGISKIPELEQTSALLFYVNEKEQKVEMVSVGADGKLWIMTGHLGEESRYSQPFERQDGETSRLRFTRYNVSADRFESKMEYTLDGGKSWLPGNHQVFRRADG